MTDEAAVLGWVLHQAGIRVQEEEEQEEEIDILSFPAANAEKAAPTPPKVTPKAAKVEVEKTEQIKENVKVPEPSKDIKSKSSATEADADAEELSETVDTIKNDNNVVVFFCKYSLDWCFSLKVMTLKRFSHALYLLIIFNVLLLLYQLELILYVLLLLY